jgi:two-component system cell cycle response regulator
MAATKDRVLIVDDDPVIRDLLGSYISSFGFEYDTAKDGLRAVNKLKKGGFTITLTDMIMPNMDGMQLLKHIHENYPKIGVIVLTGYGHTFSYTDVIRAGAADFIAKPFNADELEAKLNRLVRELNLVRQLERHSICDSLTDLYNRRYFDTKILAEVQRADRQGYNIFLQMVDVDNLKSFNDAAGHLGGDQLLKVVGRILRESIRENVDWAYRFGGDEFGIVFTQVELKQIVSVAKRILVKYNEQKFTGTGLSIGIARFIRHPKKSWSEDIANLISRADKALYTAKRQGKNQIVLDEESGKKQKASAVKPGRPRKKR